MSQYYGTVIVKRSNTDDELQHWKYIKRIKGKNGKYRYIYDDSELKKYESGVKEVTGTYDQRSIPGIDTYTNDTRYEQTDSLFDGKNTFIMESNKPGGGKHTTTIVTKEQGKLSRVQAKGEKWVYDNLINSNINRSANTKRAIRNINKAVEDGKRKIKSLFRKYGKGY